MTGTLHTEGTAEDIPIGEAVTAAVAEAVVTLPMEEVEEGEMDLPR